MPATPGSFSNGGLVPADTWPRPQTSFGISHAGMDRIQRGNGCCLSAQCHKVWAVDNLFCSGRELSRRDKMAPSHSSRARRNISEIFCFAELRPSRAVSELARRAMRSDRGRRVEWEKTFPVFSAKNPQVNREFLCRNTDGLASQHGIQRRRGSSENFGGLEAVTP